MATSPCLENVIPRLHFICHLFLILFATSFFAQTRFFSTTIDSSLHPQWQVTNSSAGRDGAHTFCISCSFTKGFSILFLKRTLFFTAIDSNMHPQWQWLTVFAGDQERKPTTLIWSKPLFDLILPPIVTHFSCPGRDLTLVSESVSQSVSQWVPL